VELSRLAKKKRGSQSALLGRFIKDINSLGVPFAYWPARRGHLHTSGGVSRSRLDHHHRGGQLGRARFLH